MYHRTHGWVLSNSTQFGNHSVAISELFLPHIFYVKSSLENCNSQGYEFQSSKNAKVHKNQALEGFVVPKLISHKI